MITVVQIFVHGCDRPALVSPEDAERVQAGTWRTIKNNYVAGFLATDPRTPIYLHRFILDAPKKLWVDHINHDVLDNRRENLRICTPAQSQANRKPKRDSSSQYKGVRLARGRWVAKIKNTHLGIFGNEEAAARCYDAAARQEYGTFAYLNFPEGA